MVFVYKECAKHKKKMVSSTLYNFYGDIAEDLDAEQIQSFFGALCCQVAKLQPTWLCLFRLLLTEPP